MFRNPAGAGRCRSPIPVQDEHIGGCSYEPCNRCGLGRRNRSMCHRAVPARTYCFTGCIHEFELNRTLGPLLYDDGAIPQTPARNQIADVMILVPVPSLDGGSRPGARWAGGQMLSHNLVEQQIAYGHARHLWLWFPREPRCPPRRQTCRCRCGRSLGVASNPSGTGHDA